MMLCHIGKSVLESKDNYLNYVILNKYTVRNVNVKLIVVCRTEMCPMPAYTSMLVT